MGTVFTGMGLVTLMFPCTILRLSIPAIHWSNIISIDHVNPTVKLITQCFGSQAVLSGILILFSDFSTTTFTAFGISIIPFFIFDYLAWQAGLLTKFGAIGDGIGNLIFCFCSYYGYQGLKAKAK